jgi:hypothetical protein
MPQGILLMLSVKLKVRGESGDYSFIPVEGIALSFTAVEKLLNRCWEQLGIRLLLYCRVVEPPEFCGVT